MSKILGAIFLVVFFLICFAFGIRYLTLNTIVSDHNNSLYESENVVVSAYSQGANRILNFKENDYNQIQLFKNIIINSQLDYHKEIEAIENQNSISLEIEDKTIKNMYQIDIKANDNQ